MTVARVVGGLVLLAAIWPSATAAGPPVEAYFTAPRDGTVVQGSPWLRVTGRAAIAR